VIAILLALAVLVPVQAPEKATLRVMDKQPLVVRGTGFRPGERVLVIAAARRNGDERVVATAAGSFVARFDFAVPRCARLWIRAIGTRGTHASYFTRIAPDCQPPDSRPEPSPAG
jgi:hypothetical protein